MLVWFIITKRDWLANTCLQNNCLPSILFLIVIFSNIIYNKHYYRTKRINSNKDYGGLGSLTVEY